MILFVCRFTIHMLQQNKKCRNFIKELMHTSKQAIEALGERDISHIFILPPQDTSTRIILKKSKTLAYILCEWKKIQNNARHMEIDMITSMYAHIWYNGRKVNAQKFETAFYFNSNLYDVHHAEEP